MARPILRPQITWTPGGDGAMTRPGNELRTTAVTAVIKGIDQEYRLCLVASGRILAKEMQDHARANHRWQNITGRAERSLIGEVVFHEGAGRFDVAVTIGHDLTIAPHGFWLAVAHNGVWDIIAPTQELYAVRAPQFLQNSLAQRLRAYVGNVR